MRSTGSILIEVLSVLFIVGLLAAVAIPDFADDEPEVRHKALITSLETVRTALDRYRADHKGAYPSIQELHTLKSATHPFRVRTGLAAYLDQVPDNPFTEGSHVDLMDAPVGTSDWAYDPSTGVFKANDSEEHRRN